MELVRKNILDIQVFTRITKDMDVLLDKVAEDQERSKSFVLRKALNMYLSANNSNSQTNTGVNKFIEVLEK